MKMKQTKKMSIKIYKENSLQRTREVSLVPWLAIRQFLDYRGQWVLGGQTRFSYNGQFSVLFVFQSVKFFYRIAYPLHYLTVCSLAK